MNNEGYDSEGGLPHFVDKEDDDMEGYSELQIGGNAPAPPAPAAVAANLTVESVMRLAVKDLKDELKKRGRATSGGKNELQDRLKEAMFLLLRGMRNHATKAWRGWT